MKLKNILYLILCVSLLLTACTSTKTEKPIPDPNFIADFDPIQLDNIMCIQESFGKIKPIELEAYFIPRANIIEVHFKKGMNNICFLFDSQEREKLFEGITLYASDIEKYREDSRTALPAREATRDNYYTEGTMSIAWGVIGFPHNNTTTFQTNYKYLETNKPYFELKAERTTAKDDPDIYSPNTRIYFSPTHLETLCENMAQETLQALVDEKLEEAFAF